MKSFRATDVGKNLGYTLQAQTTNLDASDRPFDAVDIYCEDS